MIFGEGSGPLVLTTSGPSTGHAYTMFKNPFSESL